ncbi:MAG: glutamate 5-kinase [Gammaproteobacteria bacterium]|nr:glutamate 5-kinase [Gammaproteobacteria bacterium]
MSHREAVTGARRWVIKIGSALLTDQHSGLNAALVDQWIRQISTLREQRIEIVVVSSGSIVEGMHRLGWHTRPHEVFRLQAAAAVGQMGLVQMYESAFQRFGMRTAQVLLTGGDLSDRHRYLNARSALRALLELRVVPIVNENDTVVTDEIQFGDNDTLAALVANLCEADLLVILTDQEGLYDADPRTSPQARLVPEGRAEDPRLRTMAGPGSALGRGGMVTKLTAAEKAARSGAATVICSGKTPDVLTRLRDGEGLGTLLVPGRSRLAARKQWLAGRLTAQGTLRLDDGAVEVLRQAGRSLLPVGVTEVIGRFERGDLVVCQDQRGTEIARGLVNYSAEEAGRIIGHASSRIESILGYVGEPELIHRDNMVVL